MVEGEALVHYTSAVKRVVNHLYLWDTIFDLGALLEPTAPKSYTTTAEAVKDQVEALLKKFLAVDPVARADGKDNGDVIDNGAPQASDGGAQG